MDAVIFDFDGLIVDTEWPAFSTAADVFRDHGCELTVEQWAHRIGRGDNGRWTDLLAAAVGAIDHEVIDAERRFRKNELTDAQPPLPGVIEQLDAADALGLATAVASSSPTDWVERHLRRVGLHHRFRAVRTRDHVPRAKPWPDVFLAAAEAIEVDPARVVVFEDSVHGVAAAKRAGMVCIAVPNRITAGGDFSAADAVVASLAEVDLAAFVAHGAVGRRATP